MRPDQQKSFGTDSTYYWGEQPDASKMTHHTDRPLELPTDAIAWLLRRSALVMEKLFVVAKYQFYKYTAIAPSMVRVPWLKLCMVGLLCYLAFKRDVNVSMGMGEPMVQFGNTGIVEEVSLRNPENGPSPFASLVTAIEKKDYFADAPTDDADTRAAKAYIRRFKKVALAEKEKYGIPASINMAQALVESNAGRSSLTKKTNNHFGIKCFSRTCRKGHCTNFGDDSHKDFFRKYKTSWESWRAHSKLIVNGKYKSLLKYGGDYKKWARGLKKLGYATARHYDDALINTIEKYHLNELDK
ncbi:MAG: glycoside hydrolase family 73 protein [Saprospiraceae bacterium]